MSVKIKTRAQMVYQLVAVRRDRDGNEVSRRESVEIPNVFTDYGIENIFGAPGTIGSASQIVAVVGTGSSQPSVTDTFLDNYLAGKSAPGASATRAFVDNEDGTGYVQIAFTANFAVGEATGNISEVGATQGTSGDISTRPIISRALVLDGNGNPTTFEVLEDEELQLILFFRNHIEYTDNISVVNVNGSDYTVTLRPCALGGNLNNYWNFPGSFHLDTSSRAIWGTGINLADPTSGSTPDGTGAGSGGANLAQGAQGGVNPYVPNSKQRSAWIRVPTGAARDMAGAYMITPLGTWQVGFSPSIPKTGLERFTLTVMFSMDNTP